MTDGGYDRLRSPAPLLPRRVPSGRRAMEQPNATGDGDARLTLRFWGALLVVGVATGLFGCLMVGILHSVQDLARSSDEERLAVLAAGGLLVGLLAWLIRRVFKGDTDVDDAVWTRTGQLGFGRCLAVGSLSELAVGVGGSLGQEAAPKLLGAAAGSRFADWLKLDEPQRRLLVACGAGAGMGAVYNVPLGGALITAELLLASLTLPVVLPALLCSSIATMTTWLFLPQEPTYLHVPEFHTTTGLVFFAILLGPVFGGVAVAIVRGVGWVSHHQLRGRPAIVGPVVAFTAVGLAALWQPVLLGNGKGIAALSFFSDGKESLLLLAGLVVLKPLLTLLCLGSGASGGLFTPVLSTGAALGLLIGEVWPGTGTAVGAFAIVGAAALSGAAMQAPVAACVLVLELTSTTEPVLLPLLVATALATTVARYLDGYSVYSARLPALS